MDQIDVLSGLVRHSGLTSFVPEVCSEFHNQNQRESILILEDDPLQLRLLRQQLDAVGFQVSTAASIQEALLSLARQSFQLAIFDVQLPDGSGFDLCEQLDSQPAHVGMPIIVLSSMTEASAVRQTRAAGGRYFLCKPYDPNVLLAIIERALADLRTC